MTALALVTPPIGSLEPPAIGRALAQLADKRILITGGHGSIGNALSDVLWEIPAKVLAVDLHSLDVRDENQTKRMIGEFSPEVIFHLAADKHAPQGELYPADVAETNITGTKNVVDAAYDVGARVVLASTCKAADPETVYGASKLIAERIVLNAGGSVARFYNVVESAGNVFEIWANTPGDEPILVTPCERYFISADDAVALLLWSAVLAPGRYTIDPGHRWGMTGVARMLYPTRRLSLMGRRRGDRYVEPLRSSSEIQIPVVGVPRIERIVSEHDEGQA